MSGEPLTWKRRSTLHAWHAFRVLAKISACGMLKLADAIEVHPNPKPLFRCNRCHQEFPSAE